MIFYIIMFIKIHGVNRVIEKMLARHSVKLGSGAWGAEQGCARLVSSTTAAEQQSRRQQQSRESNLTRL